MPPWWINSHKRLCPNCVCVCVCMCVCSSSSNGKELVRRVLLRSFVKDDCSEQLMLARRNWGMDHKRCKQSSWVIDGYWKEVELIMILSTLTNSSTVSLVQCLVPCILVRVVVCRLYLWVSNSRGGRCRVQQHMWEGIGPRFPASSCTDWWGCCRRRGGGGGRGRQRIEEESTRLEDDGEVTSTKEEKGIEVQVGRVVKAGFWEVEPCMVWRRLLSGRFPFSSLLCTVQWCRQVVVESCLCLVGGGLFLGSVQDVVWLAGRQTSVVRRKG